MRIPARLAFLALLAAPGLPAAAGELGLPNRQLAALRIGLDPDDGVKFDFKGAALRLRGASKVPFTGGVALDFRLPEEFTLLVSYQLPEKLSAKKLAALVDYSAGLYLATASGPAPVASFVLEHQTTAQGFAQSFVTEARRSWRRSPTSRRASPGTCAPSR